MRDMRISIYVSLMLVCLTLAATDPFAKIAEVLKNEYSFNYYSNCFLDKGPCSGDGRALKRMLPDFINTSCSRCSDKNKQTGCRVILTLMQQKYQDVWSEFLLKYDPDNLNRHNLDIFLSECRDRFHITMDTL